MLKLLIRGNNDGILIPEPIYPLYRTLVELLGGVIIPYRLDEDENWTLNIRHLYQQIEKYKSKGVNIRGLVAINPGNPTGSVKDR